MKKNILSLILCLFCLGNVFSQNKPFPQELVYHHAIKPDVSGMTDDIENYYKEWKDLYIKESLNLYNGLPGYYVDMVGTGSVSNEITTSEAMGYGMLLMVLMDGVSLTNDTGNPIVNIDEKTIFDGMLEMVLAFPSRSMTREVYGDSDYEVIENGLMCWYIPDDEEQDEWGEWIKDDNNNARRTWPCNATDGDMDIAYALLLAHEQWGDEEYLKLAIERIYALKYFCMDPDRYYLYAADTASAYMQYTDDEAKRISRPSDWMIGHILTFYYVTGDSDWLTTALKAQNMIDSILDWDNNEGFVPDFVQMNEANGLVEPVEDNFSPDAWEYPTDAYDYNASRVPWRIGQAYLNHNFLNKNFIDSILDYAADLEDADTVSPVDFEGPLGLDGNPVTFLNDAAYLWRNKFGIYLPGDPDNSGNNWDGVALLGMPLPENISDGNNGTPGEWKIPDEVIDLLEDWNLDLGNTITSFNELTTAGNEHTYESSLWYSPITVASMFNNGSNGTDEQDYINRGWNAMKDAFDPYDESNPEDIMYGNSYFENTINFLCMMVVSGNFWAPHKAQNDSVNVVIKEPVLSSGSNLSFTNVDITLDFLQINKDSSTAPVENYYSLQYAIDDVPDDSTLYADANSSRKDHIRIIDRNDITIIGPGTEENDMTLNNENSLILKLIDSDDIHLENLKFNSHFGAVHINNSDNLVIKNCYFSSKYSALTIVDSDTIDIWYSKIDAAASSASSITDCKNVLIYRNYYHTQNFNALQIEDTENIRIYHNLFDGGPGGSNHEGRGINFSDTSSDPEIEVANNIIWKSSVGIYRDKPDRILIHHNCYFEIPNVLEDEDDNNTGGGSFEAEEEPINPDTFEPIEGLDNDSNVIDAGVILNGLPGDVAGDVPDGNPDIGLMELGGNTNTAPPWTESLWYNTEDTVTFNGEIWECDIAHWSESNYYPGAPGIWLWLRVKIEPAPYEWKLLTRYETGDLVEHEGAIYECIQVHVSYDPNWAPPQQALYWQVDDTTGENIIENGTFENGFNSWGFYVDSNANATSNIENGQFRSYIPDGGYEMWHVQLFQEDIELIQGETYELTFDAKAVEGTRTINAFLQENGGNYTAYNDNYEVSLSTSMQEYTITFTMNHPTDNYASLNFEMGITPYDVIIDNVELREVNP